LFEAPLWGGHAGDSEPVAELLRAAEMRLLQAAETAALPTAERKQAPAFVPVRGNESQRFASDRFRL
jgi:hypothetical protein